jgi:hypothetical protein
MGVATGFAKLEHHPGEAFMKLFVDPCMATELKDFNPQNLANTINGKGEGFLTSGVIVYCRSEIGPLAILQAWPSSSMTPGRPS